MKITRKQLRLWGACYDDAEIASLVPESGLTPMEIAALDIPAGDRLWVLIREEVLPDRALRLLACDWAEAACSRTDWTDERSMNAIAVARRFANGEASEAELAAAAAAAWSASRAASRAARSAASADWAAAATLTDAVAAAASAEGQLADVVKVLRG